MDRQHVLAHARRQDLAPLRVIAWGAASGAEGDGGHLAVIGLAVDRERPLETLHGRAEGLFAVGAEEVCPCQRREDAGNPFAFGSVAGRALDSVKIGAVGLDQGRRQG